jgi:hypothetical protein
MSVTVVGRQCLAIHAHGWHFSKPKLHQQTIPREGSKMTYPNVTSLQSY